VDESESPETTASRASIIVAKIALIGTIMAAVIGATATITVALVQRNNPPTPNPIFRPTGANALSATSTPTPMPTTSSATTPASPDGVTYQCTGSTPAGINITYGPAENPQQATSLPLTVHDDIVRPTATAYSLEAQLNGGGGHVTCTLALTDYGKVHTDSATASGADNEATIYICRDGPHLWRIC
jgi:hypothetical protein